MEFLGRQDGYRRIPLNERETGPCGRGSDRRKRGRAQCKSTIQTQRRNRYDINKL